MATGQEPLLRHVRRLAAHAAEESASDAALLGRFIADKSEAAFAALVTRHGGMVLRVCRRVLKDSHLAEDAFQAAFLVLARKADTVRPQGALAGWLHGVAYRVALKARTRGLRSRNLLVLPSLLPDRNPDPLAEISAREVLTLLDEEVRRLPEMFRLPVILCCLEGRSQEEAARHFGWTSGSVKGRLERGRARLHKNLVRRGLTIPAVLGVAELSREMAASVAQTALHLATVRASLAFAGRQAMTAGTFSVGVTALAEDFVKSMVLSRLIHKAVMALAATILIAGVGAVARHTLAESSLSTTLREMEELPFQSAETAKPVLEPPHTDRLGDPLPPGALARLGTVRMRHGDNISNVAFLPGGKAVMSADWHGVHVWDAATGRRLRQFGDPGSTQFQSTAFSDDGRIVALSMQSGNIEIWDAATGVRLRSFWAGRFPGLQLSPDGKTLAVRDRGDNDRERLRLWDAMTGKELHQPGSFPEILSLVFSADGKTLLVVGEDKSIRFWDIASGRQMRQLDHVGHLVQIAISPDGRTLAGVGATKFESANAKGWISGADVVLLDLSLSGGKETHRLSSPGGKSARAPTFAPDGRTLVAGDGRAIYWWDVATGKLLAGRELPVAWVLAMAFSSDGGTLATGGSDQTVRLWDVATGKEKLAGGGHQGAVHAAAIAPDGRTYVTGGGDQSIREWDAVTGEQRRLIVLRGHQFHSLSFAPDGRTLVSWGVDGSHEYSARAWNLSDGREMRRFTGAYAVLSADGKALVTAGEDKALHVYQTSTGKEVRRWQLPGPGTYPLAFSNDGKTIISFAEDKIVRFWELATGRELRHFAVDPFPEDPLKRIYCHAVSPDWRFIAFGGQGHFGVLYDLATGREVKQLPGLPGALSSLVFSRDSRILASGDWSDGSVRLWEVATGQQFRQFDGHLGRVFGMAFSKDSLLLLTGSEDTTALLWDIAGRDTGPPPSPLTPEDFEASWEKLAGNDAIQGQQAVRAMVAVPARAIPLMMKRLPPAKPIDRKKFTILLGNLDSDTFEARERASAELERIGALAELPLREALAGKQSAEVRQRLEQLLAKLERAFAPERLRMLRALQALEQMNTPSSRQLLERLANGAPEALLTHLAKECLHRIEPGNGS